MSISGKDKDYSPNDDLYTPPEVFDALNVQFDMDVCAPSGGLDWIPAKTFIDMQQDGLTSEWKGVVWMNPPYSNPTPWVNKWLDHKNGFALLPFSRANWFIKLWDSDAACFATHLMMFVNTEGKRKCIFMPSAIWAIGETNITKLKMSNLGRIR